MGSLIIALLVALEATYIFISLRAIIREKLSVGRNTGLFFGIIVANLASGILYMSPFRHLLFIALLFGLMKLVCKEHVLFYNMGLISIILGIKATLEIGGMLPILFGAMEFNTAYRLACSIGLFIFAACTRSILSRFRDIVDGYWRQDYTFYVRYLLNIGFIIALCIYIYGFTLIIR